MQSKNGLTEWQARRKDELMTREKASTAGEISDAVVIKDDNLYFLSGADGQVPLSQGHGYGLYYRDCRYLSGYLLKVGGHNPQMLANSSEHCFEAALALINPLQRGDKDGRKKRKAPRRLPHEGREAPPEKIGIHWSRFVSGRAPALYDTITFENFASEAVRIPVSLEFRATFDDVFNVRGLLPQRPARRLAVKGDWKRGVLEYGYDGMDGIHRRLAVQVTPRPASRTRGRAGITLTLKPREAKTVHVSCVIQETRQAGDKPAEGIPHSRRKVARRKPGPGKAAPRRIPARLFQPDRAALKSHIERNYRQWMESQAAVETGNQALNRLLDRSVRDLQLLRSHFDGESFFSAGIPWFATLFGRDSAMAALQTILFNPEIAGRTLRVLAHHQGKAVDAWRDEEPGKILHELRQGELAAAGKIPHTPYYGSIDATLLFLILAAKTLFWTGDGALYRDLRPHILAALDWMERHGDSDGDGYIDYPGTVRNGRLINQGWKDAGNSILRRDGGTPDPPVALVEFQGYAYRAWLDIARVFRHFGGNGGAAAGDFARADVLERQAEELRRRFNRDFWMPKQKCYALGLEKGGRQLSAIASNAGHALWSGIADPRKARQTMRRLMAADMNGGWGIRTLSTLEKPYNPVSYHLGSVWPHENGFIAAGFRRYGFDEAATTVFKQIVDATLHFRNGRLPELYGGQSRADYSEPVRYPTACHPQAWGAGTIPFMIRTLLGLEPDAFGKKLRIVRPLLPELTEYLILRRVKVGGGETDLRFGLREGRVGVEVLRLRGKLTVEVED